MANSPLPASRPLWSTRLGFIMAAAGSAIGLGNVWKFPYITGQNGGGAFVLVYLVCIVAVGLPIMMAELMIGRHTRRDAVGAFGKLVGRRSPWLAAGWISLGAAFIILSYYSVVAGWTFDYIWLSLLGSFSGQSAATIEGMFGELTGSGSRQLFWHGFFVLAALGIVIGGVQKGIERWNKILMPLLFLLLGILVVNGLLSEGAWEGIKFMFRPDFHRLTPGSVLEAMGHSFFTLSLGMAAMITYGSYLNKKEDLLSVSLRVVILDTLIALMAGVAIFSVVFSVGMVPAAGPGLVFKTIPVVFSQVAGGYFLAILFFLLLAFAALTSAVSLLEAQVAYLIDERGWARGRATLFLAFLAFLVGIPSALSFNALGNWHLLGERSFFDSADLLATNYLLPISGLLISVYVGWFWSGREEKAELLAGGAGWIYPTWHFAIRFISPAAVAIVLFFKVRETGLFAWLASRF
jgi:NSS family neurotransmitter:Na+ symporter